MGWDWRRPGTDADAPFGVRAQLMLLRTWTGPIDHRTAAFSVNATFGFD